MLNASTVSQSAKVFGLLGSILIKFLSPFSLDFVFASTFIVVKLAILFINIIHSDSKGLGLIFFFPCTWNCTTLDENEARAVACKYEGLKLDSSIFHKLRLSKNYKMQDIHFLEMKTADP